MASIDPFADYVEPGDIEDAQRKMDEEILMLSAILRYCKKKGQYPFKNSASSDDFASSFPELEGSGEDLMKKFFNLDKKYKELNDAKGSGNLLKDPCTRIQFHLWTAITEGTANLRGDPLADYDDLRESPLVSSLPQPFLQEKLQLLSRSELKQFNAEWENLNEQEMKAKDEKTVMIVNQKNRLGKIMEGNAGPSADA